MDTLKPAEKADGRRPGTGLFVFALMWLAIGALGLFEWWSAGGAWRLTAALLFLAGAAGWLLREWRVRRP